MPNFLLQRDTDAHDIDIDNDRYGADAAESSCFWDTSRPSKKKRYSQIPSSKKAAASLLCVEGLLPLLDSRSRRHQACLRTLMDPSESLKTDAMGLELNNFSPMQIESPKHSLTVPQSNVLASNMDYSSHLNVIRGHDQEKAADLWACDQDTISPSRHHSAKNEKEHEDFDKLLAASLWPVDDHFCGYHQQDEHSLQLHNTIPIHGEYSAPELVPNCSTVQGFNKMVNTI